MKLHRYVKHIIKFMFFLVTDFPIWPPRGRVILHGIIWRVSAVNNITSDTAVPISTKLHQIVASISPKNIKFFFSGPRPIWPPLLKIAKIIMVFSVTSWLIWIKLHRYVKHVSLFQIHVFHDQNFSNMATMGGSRSSIWCNIPLATSQKLLGQFKPHFGRMLFPKLWCKYKVLFFRSLPNMAAITKYSLFNQ